MIYADNAATTKMSEAALHTMMTLMSECWGNPSSLYVHGQLAKEALEQARVDIAAVIGAQPREIIFTSGGSEADNQAIRSAAALGLKKGKKHIVSSAFEHHAVLHILEALKREGQTIWAFSDSAYLMDCFRKKWYVNWQKEMMSYANVYAGLIIIAVLCSLLITLLFKVRDKVLVWQKGVIKW